MPVDPQLRRDLARLQQVLAEQRQALAHVQTSQSGLAAVLADASMQTRPAPPVGQRYVTLEEYRMEFPTATQARRLQILGIRTGLVAPETVAL